MNATERTAAYRAILDLSVKSEKSVSDFISPDLESARVRLGTSVADYSIPYIMYSSLGETFDYAMKELAYLFLYRNKDALREENEEFLLIDYGVTADLRPRSFTPPSTLKNPLLRSILDMAPNYLYMLDSGIIESWLASNGRGRALLEAWSRAYIEAAAEMSGTEGEEETPYFLTWALLQGCQKAAHIGASLPVSAETKEKTTAALHIGICLVHFFAKSQLLETQKAQFPTTSRLSVCLTAVINPRTTFLSAAGTFELCSFYEVPASILGDKGTELIQKLSKYTNLERLDHDIDKFFASEKKIKKTAIKALQESHYRKAMLEVLKTGLPLDGELFAQLDRYLLNPESLQETLKSGKARKEITALIRKTAKGFSNLPQLVKKLGELAALFARYSRWRPLKPLGLKQDVALKKIRSSVTADLEDAFVASLSKEIINKFNPRSGSESDRELGELYDNGRLYNFGISPILKKKRKATNVAHYFIDLKDYTNRTALLKEDVMGDFIRKEFYEPILTIAKKHFRGLAHMEDRGGIYLNNLLGDAVSISGDVAAIVDMTVSIRRQLENYAKLLVRRQKGEGIAERREQIKVDYEGRIRETEAKGQSIEAAGGDQAKIELWEIKDHVAALKRDMASELDALTGQHLVSGSFISYGASANVITLDDDLWGDIKVSICEKINESARGTSRPGSVIAPIYEFLNMERKRLNLPELELPFQVYVGNSLGLSPSPDIELALRKAFLAGKPKEAYKLYVQASQAHVQKTISAGMPGIKRYLNKGMSIYNAGDALSGEALHAYCKASSRKLRFTEVKMPIKEIEENIRERYGFFETTLRLIVSVNANDQIRRVFHYAGSVTFKGFESAEPSEIWEMIDMENGFGQMLCESKSLKGLLISSLTD